MPRILPLHEFSAAIRQAHQRHVDRYRSRITNMKATMSRSLIVFETYMQWYPLYEEVKKITGERGAYLFAYAISSGSNCPLCTTYFRKIITDNGDHPDNLQLNDDEQLLVNFGSVIAENKGYVPEELYQLVAQKYNDTEIVILAGFAGIMIATNIFNNIIEVAIDDYLHDYLPPYQKKTK
jgi:hypothetical protein